MPDDKPLLVVFAGPNGSGKSSITDRYAQEPERLPSLYINADVIAKEQGMDAYEAAIEATRQRAEAIHNEQSFVIETVLSTHEKINFMRAAKLKGYHVHLEYITTQSSRINVDRVQNRVSKGGHDVPVDKTISGTIKAWDLLPKLQK